MENEKPFAIWGDEKDGSVTGYMCLTDFECEFGGADCGHIIYASLETFMRNKPVCTEQCGIAEVRITGVRIVQKAKDGAQ